MPYVDMNIRRELDEERSPETPGELCYVIYQNVVDYYNQFPEAGFSVFVDILGALEVAGDEFKRTYINPYEDKKKDENGDVF